jgi:hypothetical protein
MLQQMFGQTFFMFWPENNVGTWQHWDLSTNQDEVLHWGGRENGPMVKYQANFLIHISP